MATKTTITDPVFEGTTRELTALITKPDGTGFKPEALTLLLYDAESGAIINARDRVDILDLNGGQVSDGTLEIDGDVLPVGSLVLQLDPDDNVIVGPRTGKTSEVHRALLEWTWADITKYGKHEIEFTVEDHSKLP